VLRRKALKRWTKKGYISKLAPCICRAEFKDILCKSEQLGRVLALKLLFAALLPNVFFELATNGI